MPRILCIDDDPSVLALNKAFLESFGFTVLTAIDGNIGIDMAIQHSVDAVVLDYHMPMDGEQVASVLRRQAPWIPLVLSTGMREQIPPRLNALVDAVVSKGDPVTALITALERLIYKAKPRKFPRSVVRAHVSVCAGLHPFWSDADMVTGHSENVSEGGIRAVLDSELPESEGVWVTLATGSAQRLTAKARICYRERSVYGLQFLEMKEDDLSRLRQFLSRSEGYA